MRYKYSAHYNDITKEFKTKQEMMMFFHAPLYIIDKIIRKTNNEEVSTCHGIYKEFYNDVDIHLLRPTI